MISAAMLALGPFIVPAFVLIFSALLCVALWLLDKPTKLRVSLAILILAALCLQIAPLVFVL